VIDRITGSDAVNKVQSVVGDKGRDIKENFGQVDFICDPTNLVDVMTLLRDEAGLKFFTFLSAVDRTELDENKTAYGSGLEVLIHLYAPDHAMHVNVHVPVDLEDPRCPSLTDLFGGALWHERECHEMFGIDFEGHPRLVNLYLPEDFVGHPGLKSFKLPSRTTVKEWPGAKDPEEAAAGGR
jgi:NADH:ubiquinone oxidoreductase subunit C